MLLYWIWLATRKGVKQSTKVKLLERFPTPEQIYFADESALLRAEVSHGEELSSLCDKSLSEAKKILETCTEKKIHILTLQDASYPNRLRHISDPPVVLYYLGTLPAFDAEPVVAVIGSRKASVHALATAKRIGYQISACGAILVSGLAEGCDAMSMHGAVSAGKPVVAILGSGVDVIYPRRNKSLYSDIIMRGCVISEYPPGTPPLPYHFPVRNRIISGLSLGVVVVEAPSKSGSLITARLALEQGRDVFAVPGSAGVDRCAGSNKLLKEGAILAENGWDVIQEYHALFPEKIQKSMLGEDLSLSFDQLRNAAEAYIPSEAAAPAAPPRRQATLADVPESIAYIDLTNILPKQTPDEQVLLLMLQKKPHLTDEMVAETEWTTGRVLSALTLLEVKGYIRRLPGNRYELMHQTVS